MSVRPVSPLPLSSLALVLALGANASPALAQAPPPGAPVGPGAPGAVPGMAPGVAPNTVPGIYPNAPPTTGAVPVPSPPPASGRGALPNSVPGAPTGAMPGGYVPGAIPGAVPGALPRSGAAVPRRPGDARAVASAEGETLEARLGTQFAPSGGLTADEVARAAVTTSFDVRARQAEIESAAAGVDQAYYAFFPRLALSAQYTRLSPITLPPLSAGGTAVVAPGVVVPPGAQSVPVTADQLVVVPTPAFTFPVILNNYSLVARLTVPFSDYVFRLSQAHAAATHSERAALANERAARLKAAADAKNSYYQWVRARLQALVAEESLAQNQSQLLDTQRTFQAGTASRADVLNVEARVANAELLLERQKNLAALLEDRLRTIMHDASGREYGIGEDVRQDPPGVQAAPGTVVEGYNEAITQRLELRAFDDTAQSLRESAKVARAGAWPRLDGFGDVTTANPNPRYIPQQTKFQTTWSVGLQLSWSPNDVPISSAAGAVSDARAAQAEAQRNALRDALRGEILQAQNALREAQVALQTTARALVAAEEGYRVRRELFKNGRSTNLEVTDAENNLLRARYDAINARVDLRIALVNVDHALGRDAKRAQP